MPGAVAILELALLDQGAEDLLDEEGVAFGALEQRSAEFRRRRSGEAERGLDDLADFLEGQPLEAHVIREPAATELGEDVVERVEPVQLVAPVGEEQEDPRVAQLAREIGHELIRRLVGPVEVLDDDDDGAAARGVRQAFGERAVDPVALDLRDRERARPALPKLGREDRKSTRLNSSHVSISYAVFCLKKKKKQYLAILTAGMRCSPDSPRGPSDDGNIHPVRRASRCRGALIAPRDRAPGAPPSVTRRR